jgi:cobalamin biosynthesis Mg chelatase CobN
VESLARRLMEAHERGYWNPDEDVLERLREVIQQIQAQNRCR